MHQFPAQSVILCPKELDALNAVLADEGGEDYGTVIAVIGGIRKDFPAQNQAVGGIPESTEG